MATARRTRLQVRGGGHPGLGAQDVFARRERGDGHVGPLRGDACGHHDVDAVVGEQFGRVDGHGVRSPALVQFEELPVGDVGRGVGAGVEQSLHQFENVQVIEADHAQAKAHPDAPLSPTDDAPDGISGNLAGRCTVATVGDYGHRRELVTRESLHLIHPPA